MTDPRDDFEFRPLERGDLALLLRWFNAPHVRRWLGSKGSYEALLEEYGPVVEGEIPCTAFVALHAGRPVGMVEWERFGDAPDFQRVYEVDDPDASNCDVLLGEEDFAHRGLGAVMIEAFLRRIVFADPRITSCVIDPDADNAIAIRAYGKVGFRFLRALPDDGEGNSVYLMSLTRDELGPGDARDEGFYLRPARVDELATASSIDDDACSLYADAGLPIDRTRDHGYFALESREWKRALTEQRLLFACAYGGEPVGFASLGFVDGAPYLQQLSVRRAWMRRGIGRALLTRAQRWSVRAGSLTTTAQVLSNSRGVHRRDRPSTASAIVRGSHEGLDGVGHWLPYPLNATRR